jgi:voltage-gated potassium channel Kch
MTELEVRPTHGVRALLAAYSAHRYAILFYVLLATLAAGPATETLGFDADVLEALLIVSLLAAVAPLAVNRMRFPLLALLVAACLFRLVAAWLDRPELSLAGLAVWPLVALLAAAGALRFALRAQSISGEHLYAALSAYVLVGLFLGVLYQVLERITPGSLAVASDQPGGGVSLSTTVYFSFVTLATLGYGDVVPRSDAARGIAVVEAVAGQLYLAVLVARLVSLNNRIDRSPRRPAEPERGPQSAAGD